MTTARLQDFPSAERDYLTDELIAYIGNKRRLLGLIKTAIVSTGITSGTFFDAFAGAGSVSRLAKTLGLRVIANDWEPYTAFLNGSHIGQNHLPPFHAAGGAGPLYRRLNELSEPGYISQHYCPADDEHPDLERERMFFTQENGRRLDAMREHVEDLWQSGQLTPDEYQVLVASVVWAASWCSNTSGVFKGFHRGWGGATRTAWYRIRERVCVRPPVLLDNGQQNLVLQMDAPEAASQVACDIAYLDPPYNQHQYGANYHLLNTVALWDKPPLQASYTRGNKSAIRTDWRAARNSSYCRKALASAELSRLLDLLDARWILVSYSADGTIPLTELAQLVSSCGRLSWVLAPYKRYRVSSQRPSPRPHTVEFVLIADRSRRPRRSQCRDFLEAVLAAAPS